MGGYPERPLLKLLKAGRRWKAKSRLAVILQTKVNTGRRSIRTSRAVGVHAIAERNPLSEPRLFCRPSRRFEFSRTTVSAVS